MKPMEQKIKLENVLNGDQLKQNGKESFFATNLEGGCQPSPTLLAAVTLCLIKKKPLFLLSECKYNLIA